MEKNNLYKLKKRKIGKRKKQKKKIIFMKFTPKRYTPKWTCNKMGNAKKTCFLPPKDAKKKYI